MRSESEKLERNNRDMEDRLREIKQLFEHEQGNDPSIFRLNKFSAFLFNDFWNELDRIGYALFAPIVF